MCLLAEFWLGDLATARLGCRRALALIRIVFWRMVGSMNLKIGRLHDAFEGRCSIADWRFGNLKLLTKAPRLGCESRRALSVSQRVRPYSEAQRCWRGFQS